MFVKPFYVRSCEIDIKPVKKTTYFFQCYVLALLYLASQLPINYLIIIILNNIQRYFSHSYNF